MKIEEVYHVPAGEGGLHDLLGIREVFFDAAQRTCVALKITPQLLNPYGKVHGGTIAALCDVAMGCYAAQKELASVALNSELHYYRPGEADTVLTAVVNERKIGRHVSTFLVEVFDDQRRHIADAFFSSYCSD